MKIHAEKDPEELPLVLEYLDPFERVYICTHGWKPRVRSKGSRPAHKTKGVDCQARFRAQFVKMSSGKWRIQVKNAFYGHCHLVSKEVYNKYPSVRQVPATHPIMKDVELMVASGGKASRIYDYIRSNTCHYVQLTDVYNMIAKIKKSGGCLSDEDLVAELLVKFDLEAPGNVSSVDENSDGHTAVVTISSEHMRKLYKRFPEILLIDCTHKTNRYNYQLCTMMIIDQFGNGQAVQHSVIERNADWHMVKAVEQFQNVNDWEQTKIIMVDKDLNEIEVLKKMFPHARILLCHFRVIKWLRSVVRDDKKYGRYSSEVLKQMDFCVRNMVYARSDKDLDDHSGEFNTLAGRNGKTSLSNYFDANWMQCKEMWVMCYRMDIPHFRNNTNNRLENFFGKLKADLDSSMPMAQCLETIIRYQRRKEDEYVTRVIMPGTLRNINYGDEMNQFMGMTSEWLAEVFLTEYRFAVNSDSIMDYEMEDEDLYVTFRRGDKLHRVDKFSWLCSCEFSKTMLLPCRHGMMYQKHVSHLMTIPYASLPARWLRVGTLDEELVSIGIPLRISTGSDEIQRNKRVSERERFKSAQNVFGRISSELVDLPEEKFHIALAVLESWWGNLRQGDVTMNTQSDKKEMKAVAPLSQGEPDLLDAKPEAVPERNSPPGTEEEPTKPKLKPFNPRRRVGRPKKNRAADDARESRDRKEYNKGSKLRSALRGDDVVDVVEFLTAQQPPLMELSSFLKTYEVRNYLYKNKDLSVEKQMPESNIVCYLLPNVLVDQALKLIGRAAPFETVDLTSQPDSSSEYWVCSVKGLGDFTHYQLMAIQYINNLMKACRDGMQSYTWVMNDVDGVEEHKYAAELGKRILSTWPYEKLPGFSFDLGWSHLYSARARCWYNDNLIYAFMVVLADRYSNNTTIFLPQLNTPTDDKGNRIPASTLDSVAGAEKDIIFMPLNINGTHWVCLVLDKQRMTVYTYDSFDKRANQNLLGELAEELNKTCFPEKHRVVAVHSPIQKDGYNCGLFVCLFFWRRLFKDAGNDYTATGLQRRRWDVFRTVVEFSDSASSTKKEDASKKIQ